MTGPPSQTAATSPASPDAHRQPAADHVAAVASAYAGRRVALVQEWLSATAAGSEKVFQAICRLFAGCDAEALTLLDHRAPGDATDPSPVHESFLRLGPLAGLSRPAQLALMPAAWRTVRRGQRYDAAIISSHALGHSFARRVPRSLVYCHSPMRYAWLPHVDERGARSVALRPGLGPLRRLDRRASGHVGAYVANSRAVQDRIASFYGRTADVVAPPVDVGFFVPDPSVERGDHLLAVGRLVRYKRHEVSIRVAAALDRPLVIVGSGPEEGRLLGLARRLGIDLTLETEAGDVAVRDHYRRAALFLHPGNEDFGIAPVEAMACGTPVVAQAAGGALDWTDPTSGILAGPTVDELAAASGAALARRWDPEAIARSASRFGYPEFYEAFTASVLAAEHAPRR